MPRRNNSGNNMDNDIIDVELEYIQNIEDDIQQEEVIEVNANNDNNDNNDNHNEEEEKDNVNEINKEDVVIEGVGINREADEQEQELSEHDLLINEVLDEINEEKKDENEILIDADPNENQKEADQLAFNQADNSEEERKKAEELKAKVLEDSVNLTMFSDRLNTFNGMFRTNLNYNEFTSSIMNAWLFLKSDNKQVQADGKSILGDLFKKTLSDAFAVERKISYKEHRLPDYAEIIRSANELLRAAMYTQTDLYAMKNNKELFDATAFGGLSAKEMAELATGDVVWGMENMSEEEKLALDNKFAELSAAEVAEIVSGEIVSGSENMSKEEKLALANTVHAWDLDQKSDAAWEIQSAEAKTIAGEWSKADKPYEKLIEEMKALADNGKKGIDSSNSKDIYNKLAAAEWMLMQDDKMMVDDPEDPYNPIPNWGNRYWKAIIQAREALNIPKHTSMRELIQNDYAAMSKAAYSSYYNERQINELVLDPDARSMFDSLEAQKSEFMIQREAIKNTLENKEPRPEDKDPDVSRYPYPVKEEDEYKKHRDAKKENNFIKEKGPQEKMMGIDK